MGNFAENLNLGKRVLPPPPIKDVLPNLYASSSLFRVHVFLFCFVLFCFFLSFFCTDPIILLEVSVEI